MAKRLTSESIWFEWKRGRQKGLFEYYGHPSPLARDIWIHVLGIGKSRYGEGYRHPRQGNRVGHVLHYIHRGEMWHLLNGKMFRVGQGNACLLDLSRRFIQGNDQPRTLDLWWICFDGKDVPRLRNELEVERNPVFEHLDRRRIEVLFQELWRLTIRQPQAHEAEAHGMLNLVLAELFASRSRQSDWARVIGSKTTLSNKVRMAVDFIERMYFKNIGLKHIASAVDLNLHHFSRRFHDEVGLPPIQYLNRFRIEQAKRLLSTSDKSVGDIGRLVGIPDQGYFSRLFRKLTSETPHTCREKAQNTTARKRA